MVDIFIWTLDSLLLGAIGIWIIVETHNP
jgi:hypothetical protein